MADGIGAVAEDEEGEVVLGGEAVGLGDLGRLFDFDDVFGETTKAHGGKA